MSRFDKIFGILLGVILFVWFFLWKPDVLYTVESMAAIIGAYLLGKEIWGDIDAGLVNATMHLPLRFLENYYSYQLLKNTTLSLYTDLAKQYRYGKATMLPDRMDFIQQSNSQTVRLCFSRSTIRAVSRYGAAHILTMEIDPEVLAEFEKKGALIGVKLSFNRRFLWFVRSREVFQSAINHSKLGCLDTAGAWHDDAAFCRTTMGVGRVKAFLASGIERGHRIIDFADTRVRRPSKTRS